MKSCTTCGVAKPQTEFHTRAGSHDGVRADCKECRRAYARSHYYKNRAHRINCARLYTLKHRYGLTQDDWDRILVAQAGRCGICESPMTRPNEPHVDHDHDTKKVRGMLCNPCNTALGRLGDDAVGLRRALAYVEAGQ